MPRTMPPPKAAPTITKEIKPQASARDLSSRWSGNHHRLPDFLCQQAAPVAAAGDPLFFVACLVALFWRGCRDHGYQSDSGKCFALDGIHVVGRTNRPFLRPGLQG